MPVLHRRLLTGAALACGLLALVPVLAQFRAPDDNALATALRSGGHVILVRHGATIPEPDDAEPFDFDNIGRQRNLSDKGKALARDFGAALRQAGVPVGKVYTSKFHRAYETATLAGFTDIETTADLTLVAKPDEIDGRAAALRALMSVAPKPGTNTVLITHKPNIVDALGEEWSDVREGEASIFRAQDGRYVLVARVQMADWPRIAAAR
ncbi:MAG TPA: histidine phosphatase family protein [Xanthobacteraceae bacterium]|nr:histidine phosphatase family protein [Xanthobacteraceae bacterium]